MNEADLKWGLLRILGAQKLSKIINEMAESGIEKADALDSLARAFVIGCITEDMSDHEIQGKISGVIKDSREILKEIL